MCNSAPSTTITKKTAESGLDPIAAIAAIDKGIIFLKFAFDRNGNSTENKISAKDNNPVVAHELGLFEEKIDSPNGIEQTARVRGILRRIVSFEYR